MNVEWFVYGYMVGLGMAFCVSMGSYLLARRMGRHDCPRTGVR